MSVFFCVFSILTLIYILLRIFVYLLPSPKDHTIKYLLVTTNLIIISDNKGFFDNPQIAQLVFTQLFSFCSSAHKSEQPLCYH